MEHHKIINSDGQKILTQPKKKSGWKLVLWAVLLICLVYLLWTGIAAALAFRKISTGDKPVALQFLDTLKSNQLRGENDGRVNVLLLGKGGAKHPGGELTDSMMLVSINTKTKKLAMLSIPRDLTVPVKGYYASKINEVYYLGEQKKKGDGLNNTKQVVSTLFNIPVQYAVMLDFSGFKNIVDTLNGVTVNVDKPLNDFLYPAPDMIHYEPLSVKAGVQTMNGDLALKYTRSRETTSDFDRSKRQEKVLVAIKDKALTLGVLSNPKKVSDLLTTLGDHLRMDFNLSELERFIVLMKDIDKNQIINKVLDTGAGGPLIGGVEEDGVYRIRPRGDGKELQEIAQDIFTIVITTTSTTSPQSSSTTSVKRTTTSASTTKIKTNLN